MYLQLRSSLRDTSFVFQVMTQWRPHCLCACCWPHVLFDVTLSFGAIQRSPFQSLFLTPPQHLLDFAHNSNRGPSNSKVLY